MRLVWIALAALVATSACTRYPGGIAPSTIPLAPGGYTVVKKDVRGSDCLVALLGILPITTGNTTKGAIEDAIGEAPGATALVNVSSDGFKQYWILWSNDCTEVYGDAVKPN